jgi:Cft2 family RNA processing exonuclease
MEIEFLGGASGVGASSVLVELAGRRVLIDAGVRMGGRDRLPDLAALERHHLSAIFVTHAHADHIGALPLVHQHMPHVPIYATPATIRLIEVMLADAVRVMARRAAEELEFPLYDDALVASMLRVLRPLRPDEQSIAELPNVTLHAKRAGHVAGAVSLGFDAPDGRLVISGDVSVAAQRSILGAIVPAPKRPHLLVLESTYGARMHPNRRMEEQRLAQAVAEWVQRGHVLIPAFALGRAQEVILILRAAQRDGLIPEFPIYIDGLVRTVCAAYVSFPEALTPALRNHLLRGGKPFVGGSVRSVETPMQRERILEGPPCCIIASSGMLTGGPSAFYAARLVERPDAAIVVTGYQDEEAPGRRLLELAEQSGGGEITIEGRTLPLRCQVAKYALSAHADGSELTGLVRALQPKTVALVHGDPDARTALAAQLHGLAEVVLPQDGDALTVAANEQGGQRRVLRTAPEPSAPLAIGQGAPFDAAALEVVWQRLNDGSGVQTLSLRELMGLWFGDAPPDDAEEQIAAALNGPQVHFAPVTGASGLWRLRLSDEIRRELATGGLRAGPNRPNQSKLQELIDVYLGDAPDLYRRSINASSGAITLSFFFPKVAQQRYAAQLAALAQEAGVEVSVSSAPHQQALADAATALLPPGLRLLRTPSLKLDTEVVQMRCEGEADPATLRAAEAAFLEQTGWRLEIITSAPTVVPTSLTVVANPGREPVSQQEALECARTLFPGYLGCYKISVDLTSHTLTLRFYFPERAASVHAERIAQLADSTGWTIKLHPQAHQEALQRAVGEVLPESAQVEGRPSLDQGRRLVVARYRGSLTPEQVQAAQRDFAERTGWTLTLSGG